MRRERGEAEVVALVTSHRRGLRKIEVQGRFSEAIIPYFRIDN